MRRTMLGEALESAWYHEGMGISAAVGALSGDSGNGAFASGDGGMLLEDDGTPAADGAFASELLAMPPDGALGAFMSDCDGSGSLEDDGSLTRKSSCDDVSGA